MAAVHVLLNQKGGVGKSTIAINLSAVTAEVLTAGDDPDAVSPVAAVSVDPQGSAVWWADRIKSLPFHVIQAHEDLDGLRKIRELPGIKQVFVDTPGWLDLNSNGSDPLGSGSAGDALRAVLDLADHVIVPIECEPLSFDPTARTIQKVIEPRGLPYTVVINNWDPRDGQTDLNQTKDFVRHNKWPIAHTVIRHYKVHTRASAEGLVVTEYPANRVSLQASQDFFKLALELQLGAR